MLKSRSTLGAHSTHETLLSDRALILQALNIE